MGKVILLLGIAAAAAFAGPEASAQYWPPPAAKDIVVVPANESSGVRLAISLDNRSQLRVGEEVQVCFSASEPGYVSLWNVGTSGRVARLFPYEAVVSQPAAIAAGRQYCAGTAADRFAFRVSGPLGIEDTYLVWSRTADAHPRQPRFDRADGLAKDLEVLQRLDRTAWATAKATYDIVDGTVSVPALRPVPPIGVVGGGRVWVLAMGANVGGLVQANDDASRFYGQVRQAFRLAPDTTTRLIPNVDRRQFEAGMAWLAAGAAPDDLVFIYFSGHGSTVRDDNGDEADGLDEVFVTYDVEASAFPSADMVVRDDAYAVMVQRIRGRIVSLLDTCHSGGLYKGVSVLGGREKSFARGAIGTTPAQSIATTAYGFGKDLPNADLENIKGTVIAAAREDQYAIEGPTGSLFTVAWLDAVGQGGSLRSIFDRAALATQQSSGNRQSPILLGDTRLLETVRLD